MEQLTNMFIILCFTFPKTSRESPFQIKFIHLSSHNLQGFICSRNTEPRVTDETAMHLRVRSRGKEQVKGAAPSQWWPKHCGCALGLSPAPLPVWPVAVQPWRTPNVKRGGPNNLGWGWCQAGATVRCLLTEYMTLCILLANHLKNLVANF